MEEELQQNHNNKLVTAINIVQTCIPRAGYIAGGFLLGITAVAHKLGGLPDFSDASQTTLDTPQKQIVAASLGLVGIACGIVGEFLFTRDSNN